MEKIEKIERLTPDQEKELVKFMEEWLAVGLCTDPADRTKAEQVITGFYARLGKPKPYFWWSHGIMTSEIIMNILPKLKDLGANLEDNLRNNLKANLEANLWDNLKANLEANLWDNLKANLGNNLWAN